MLTDVEEFRPQIPNCDVLMGYFTPLPPYRHICIYCIHIYMKYSTRPYHTMAHCLSVGLVLILAVATLLSEATGRFCTERPSFPVILSLTLSVSLSYTPFLSTHTPLSSFLYHSFAILPIFISPPLPFLSHFQIYAIIRVFLFLLSFRLLTSHSQEADSSSASEEIPRFLWKSNFHYCVNL